jgi:type VI protein secretion system component VasF
MPSVEEQASARRQLNAFVRNHPVWIALVAACVLVAVRWIVLVGIQGRELREVLWRII